MPDTSNDDLKHLIQHIIKRIDVIESKLDLLLVEKNEPQCTIPTITTPLDDCNVDQTFEFAPIANDEDLELVSTLIEEDGRYVENLRLMLLNKDKFSLEDVFTETFLLQYNLTGLYGKRKLEGLSPYELIYKQTRRMKGESDEDIKKFTVAEVHRIKKRVSARKNAYQQSQGKSVVESQTQEDLFLISEIETGHEFIKDEPDDSEDYTEHKWSAEEEVFVPVNSYQNPNSSNDVNGSFTDQGTSYRTAITTNTGFEFHPINNDRDLELVSHRLRTDPHYVNQLRQVIKDVSRDGQCCLEQIFTLEFLLGCNLHGMLDKRKLSELLPYKSIFFYLRKEQGQSLKEIEADAMKELRRVKRRVYTRQRRSNL